MRISISHNALRWLPDEEIFGLIAKAGFEAIDFRMTDFIGAKNDPQAYEEKAKRQVSVIRSLGLELGQAHGPYVTGMDLYKEPETLFAGQMQILKTAEKIELPYLVMHPLVFTWCVEGHRRQEAKERNLEWFSRFIPVLKDSHVKMCMENCYVDDWDAIRTRETFGSVAEDMVEVIDTLNTYAGQVVFGACLDVGHCHCCCGDEVELARRLGKRLLAVHMHENDRRDDHHLPPFAIQGGASWELLMPTLAEIGYQGNVNFEMDSVLLCRSPALTDNGLKLLYEIGNYLRKRFMEKSCTCRNGNEGAG